MYTIFRVALATMLFVLSLFGQHDVDSLVYSHPEVLVKGSSLAEAMLQSATFERVLAGDELRHLAGMPVDRALRRSGLVYVRDRGGRSSVTTVGLRGNSATQTSMTLNGFPLVNEQNGIVDMGLYPLEIMGQVSIVRGSQSAFSGSGGIGGSIHLLTTAEEGQDVAVRGGLGSYDARSASVRVPLHSTGIPVTVHTGVIHDGGSFQYESDVSGVHTSGTRHGNASDMTFGLLETQVSVGESTLLNAMVYGVQTDRGSPGPVSIQPAAEATLSDRMVRAGARIVTRGGSVMWEAQVSGHTHRQRYVDRSVLLPVDDSYTNTGGSALGRALISLPGGVFLTAGAEAGHHGIVATTITLPEGSSRAAVFTSLRYPIVEGGAVVYPSLRLDMFSGLSPILSWKLAIHQPVLTKEGLTLRLGVGTGFRMPTFNERFWRPGGNPGLRHEEALMVEGGVASRFSALGRHDVKALGYWSEVSDKIVGWPAVNAERSGQRGTEVTWSWIPDERIEIRAGAALAEVRSLKPFYGGKQFPYIPRATGSGEIILRFGAAELSGGVEVVSRRYSTIDNIPALSSDPYTLTSGSLVMPASLGGIRWVAMLFVDNVLDERFEIVKGYPMPGRSFHVTVSLEVP